MAFKRLCYACTFSSLVYQSSSTWLLHRRHGLTLRFLPPIFASKTFFAGVLSSMLTTRRSHAQSLVVHSLDNASGIAHADLFWHSLCFCAIMKHGYYERLLKCSFYLSSRGSTSELPTLIFSNAMYHANTPLFCWDVFCPLYPWISTLLY